MGLALAETHASSASSAAAAANRPETMSAVIDRRIAMKKGRQVGITSALFNVSANAPPPDFAPVLGLGVAQDKRVSASNSPY